MYKEKIGIVGGFGAYATLNFYKRILEVFASESERNYPHIIMDNNFTMPSRTRALLYDEEYDAVVEGIAQSMRMMIQQGVEKIILVCGTAHYFLEDVYMLVPQARDRVVDIIDVLGEELQKRGEEEALIIAAEGALKKELYVKKLKKYNVSCINPGELYYDEIRYFIEGVKRNELSEDMAQRFMQFLESFKTKNVILGCTEFPVLVNYILGLGLNLEEYYFLDPLEMTIMKLRNNLV